jgi:NAD+ synthase
LKRDSLGSKSVAVPALALKIDAALEADRISRNIRELLDANSAEGVSIGLSGGIDSAVLATLGVRAVGKERVSAYHLYDRDSSKQSRAKAKFAAEWLGIDLELRDITAVMRRMGIYSPLIMRVTALSSLINRCLDMRLSRFLWGESFFIHTLRKGSFPESRVKRFIYSRTVGPVEAAFNARHRYRRQFLEKESEQKNRLVLGAANRSEWLVGWFVKGGIDDLPLSPLVGLYKTQVLELAEYLEVPAGIRNQKPSPDMMKGVTDESALGISYRTLDIILDCIEHGMSDEEIVAKGISRKDVRLVRTMNKLSAWKREPERVTSGVNKIFRLVRDD